MPRKLLPEDKIHPAIRPTIDGSQIDIVNEVEAAIGSNDVVVIGMAQNPFPKKARKALDAAGIEYTYLEYGSYLKEWRRRNALKMWSGWPTFPMVFNRGVLIGGFNELQKLLAAGEIK